LSANPTDFGIPANRHRLYIVASKRLSLGELEEVPKLVAQMRVPNGQDPYPLDMFLLPKGHSLIAHALTEELDHKASTKHKDKPKRRKDRRASRKSKNQPLTFLQDPVCASTCPWLDTITDREYDILKELDFSRVADLSQGFDMCAPTALDHLISLREPFVVVRTSGFSCGIVGVLPA
jgi:hypothetical protein